MAGAMFNLVLGAVGVLASCGVPGCRGVGGRTAIVEPKSVEKVEKVDRVTLASGMVIEDLRQGSGELCVPGAKVLARYVGNVQGAPKPFDVSGPDGRWLDLGGNLIRGWKEGLPGMRVGGTRRLTIPPELGYGTREVKDARGAVVVAPGSTLVYEVDLLELGQAGGGQ
jgi:FKBP-type peptidyl-prolyl cis-trans isomerase